jgi:hypothetical protein
MRGCYGWAVVRTFLTKRLVRKAAAGVKGGVILFRGNGTAARRYLEADRSQADDYYLQGGTALAEFTTAGRCGAGCRRGTVRIAAPPAGLALTCAT